MNIRGIALSILSAATFVACNSPADLVAPAESETESVQQAVASPPECKAGFAECDGMAKMDEADVVTDWNEIILNAVTAGRPGPTGVADIALVHAALHDAVQAIDRRYEPYFAEVPGAHGSRAAAAAAAAHDVLVGFYSTQAATLEMVDTTYFNYLTAKGLTGNPGLEVGQKVAVKIIPLRRLNPDPLPLPFFGGMEPGQWRPTNSFIVGNPTVPAPFSPMLAPWLGNFDPFTLTGPARFRAAPPPALTSEHYTKDYNEVKAFGSFGSTDRTPEQTEMAYFWSENFVAQWNRAMRGIAAKHIHKTGESARLFALANLAIADALITAWESKNFYVFWRPLTAIVEGNNDGNPDTAGDDTWQPLVNTPNYPDYTSGANNITGAATRTLALYFRRDHMKFEVTSLAPLAVQKSANLPPLLGCSPGSGRRTRPSGDPLPFRGYRGKGAGTEDRRVGLQSLPAADQPGSPP